MPNAITASGIHNSVPDEIEVWPALNAVQAKRAIAMARNPTNTVATSEAAISANRRAAGIKPPEHQRDADMPAGAQRHGGAEREARRHQV